MKRFNFGLFIMVLLVTVLFATVAYCGVWESFKNNAFEGLITLFFVILSGIFGKKVMNYKNAVNNLYATFREFKNDLSEKSEGGKELTKNEIDRIIAKMVINVEDIFALIPIKWLPKKG